MSNFFTIFAHGKDFDVKSFLHQSSLKVDNIWLIGEQKRNACVNALHETSGLEIILGDGRELTIFEQYEIAYQYLNKNKSQLKQLAQEKGVTTFNLGLHYSIKMEPELVGFCMGAPKQLNSLALEINIDPVFYVYCESTENEIYA
jgi:hypothetical protein